MKKLLACAGALGALLITAACEYEPDETYDHESSESCAARGYQPGSKEYNDCRHEEQSYQQLMQERQQIDEQRRQQEMWNNARTRY
jgi:hypothetical protein